MNPRGYLDERHFIGRKWSRIPVPSDSQDLSNRDMWTSDSRFFIVQVFILVFLHRGLIISVRVRVVSHSQRRQVYYSVIIFLAYCVRIALSGAERCVTLLRIRSLPLPRTLDTAEAKGVAVNANVQNSFC